MQDNQTHMAGKNKGPFKRTATLLGATASQLIQAKSINYYKGHIQTFQHAVMHVNKFAKKTEKDRQENQYNFSV